MGCLLSKCPTLIYLSVTLFAGGPKAAKFSHLAVMLMYTRPFKDRTLELIHSAMLINHNFHTTQRTCVSLSMNHIITGRYSSDPVMISQTPHTISWESKLNCDTVLVYWNNLTGSDMLIDPKFHTTQPLNGTCVSMSTNYIIIVKCMHSQPVTCGCLCEKLLESQNFMMPTMQS